MSNHDTLWVEAYRPTEFDDVVGHDVVRTRMERFASDPEMPNLLLAGRQGIGKTALVHCLARKKYGDGWRKNILELNASDNRGIDVVRDDIKTFARQGGVDESFGIVFLDEADQLTKDAQPALRRIMEDYDDRTRFILSCNYPNQIIAPIQSRCATFRMTALGDEEVREVMDRVIDAEELEVEERAAQRIVADSRGDARKAINTLQGCVLDGTLKDADAMEIVGTVDDSLIREIVESTFTDNLDEAMTRLEMEVLKDGVPEETVIDSFLRVIKRMDMSEHARMRALDAIGEADWRLRQGANPNAQFNRLLASFVIAKHNTPKAYEPGN